MQLLVVYLSILLRIFTFYAFPLSNITFLYNALFFLILIIFYAKELRLIRERCVLRLKDVNYFVIWG